MTTIDLSGSCTGASYLLIEPIGGGGTGRVWRALDRDSGEQVAVKLLHRELMSSPKAVSRFVQERSILLMLEHRHIVRVRDLLTIGESLGLVMDLMNGGSLREHVRQRRTLPPAVAAAVLAQVAAALTEAHRLGVVHRDLKPDNILVDTGPDGHADAQAGAVPHVRLTDFGIARLLDSPGITTPQALVGTPNYLAPEVITGGAASPAADVYAMGVLLYELLLGRPPFNGGPVLTILRRHVECEPVRHPGVPDEAWRAITTCMTKDPGHRPTADALVTTMRTLARQTAGKPAAPRVAAAPPRQQRSSGATALPAALPAPVPDRPAEGPVPPRANHAADHAAGQRRRRWLARRWRPALALTAGALGLALFGSAAGQHLPDWLTTAQDEPPAVATRVPGNALHNVDPSGGDRTPAPTATPAATPAGTETTSGTAGAQHAPQRPENIQRRQPLPRVRVQAKVYGPLECAKAYVWDVGHPAVAQPCHATGPGVRLFGRLQALPGVQADVSLTLQEVESGATAGGPFTCRGLLFTDFSREHTCGPFQLRPEQGHRYVVVQQWSYTGKMFLPSGQATSAPFSW
jgi:serine/threonine-protein kinase